MTWVAVWGGRCAMGQCYENDQLNMSVAAIRCYRRALANGDREGKILTLAAASMAMIGVSMQWYMCMCNSARKCG